MRKTDLSEVLFPVGLRDVFVDSAPKKSENRQFRKFAGHRAVVNGWSGNPIAVVSNNYRIVTNEEAIAYGRQCVQELFTKVDPGKIGVFNIIAPDTGSFCYIDLIHEGYEVNMGGREIFLPYLRIVNSYNRTRSLKFLVGFCRRVCENGVVFESLTIEFNFPHTKEKSSNIIFNIKKGQMGDLEAKFVGYLNKVKNIAVAKEQAFPAFCRGMGKSFDINSENKERKAKEVRRLEECRERVSPLIEKYFGEIGANAYALFNAMTDYASNTPADDKQEALHVPSRQRKAGAWLQEITTLAEKPGFIWEQYLEEYLAYENVGNHTPE